VVNDSQYRRCAQLRQPFTYQNYLAQRRRDEASFFSAISESLREALGDSRKIFASECPSVLAALKGQGLSRNLLWGNDLRRVR